MNDTDEWREVAEAAISTLEALTPAIGRLHRQKTELLSAIESVTLEGVWEPGADAEWLERLSAVVTRIREEDKAVNGSGRPEERRLADVVCPQCRKPFVLTWNDYKRGKPHTLIVRDCPSGGVYDVRICCPHCDYEEEL